MAKTNYTKVEEALAEGMLKMEVNRLLLVADENKKPKKTPAETTTPRSQSKIEEVRLKRLAFIQKEIRTLENQGKDPYTALNIDKKELERFLQSPATLTKEEWEQIKVLKEKILNYKDPVAGQTMPAEPTSSEDFVEQQRKKQHTKRFNINDKWIPLQ